MCVPENKRHCAPVQTVLKALRGVPVQQLRKTRLTASASILAGIAGRSLLPPRMSTLSRREEETLFKTTKAHALKECDPLVKGMSR